MPVKSRAQFRQFRRLYRSGKIDKKTLDEWLRGVNYRALPERVGEVNVGTKATYTDTHAQKRGLSKTRRAQRRKRIERKYGKAVMRGIRRK